jgi:hypothetical protein
MATKGVSFEKEGGEPNTAAIHWVRIPIHGQMILTHTIVMEVFGGPNTEEMYLETHFKNVEGRDFSALKIIIRGTNESQCCKETI